jgi:hypothetical protein
MQNNNRMQSDKLDKIDNLQSRDGIQNERLGCFTGMGIIAMLVTLFSIVGVAYASGGQMFTAGALNAKVGKSYGGVNSHAQIQECSACHTAPWEKTTMAERCVVCHANIEAQMSDSTTLHGVSASKDRECRACHPEHRGASAPLTEANHNLFAFKLDGKHAKVKCDACHQNRVFRNTPSDCNSCHQKDDKHAGKSGTDCAACHNASGWSDAKVDHNLFAFKLDGKHAGIACKDCHQNGQFKNTKADCLACHKDPAFHAGAFGVNCADCHSASSWSPAGYNMSHPTVAHEGGRGVNHGGASCKECHPSTVNEATCNSCHWGFEGGGEGGRGGEGGD